MRVGLLCFITQVARQKKAMQRINRRSHDPDLSNDASLSEASRNDIDAVGELTLSDNDIELHRRHMREVHDYNSWHDQNGDGPTDRHDNTDELLYDADLPDFSSESPQPESPFAASANACRDMEELLRRARGASKFDSSDCFVGQRLQHSSDSNVDFDQITDDHGRYSGDTHMKPRSQSQQDDRYSGLANGTSDRRLPSMELSESKSMLDASNSSRRFSDDEDCNGAGDATDVSQWHDQCPPPTTQAVGMLFERDIVGFVQQVHCQDLAVIENNLHVRLKFEEVGDRIRIDISLPRPYDMLVQNIDTARMHLGDLFDDVANVVEKKRFYYRGDDITPDQIAELMASVSHDFKNLFLHLVCHGEMLLIGNHGEIQRVCEMIESLIEQCQDRWRHPPNRGGKCGNDEESHTTITHSDGNAVPACGSHRHSRCGVNGNSFVISEDTGHYDEDTVRKSQNASGRAGKSDRSKQRTSCPAGKSPSRIPTRQQSGCSLGAKIQFDRSSNGTTQTGRHFHFSLGGNLNVIVYDGDITTEVVDIIVSAANVHLANYSGVARAISQAAGRQYDDDCTEYVARHGPLTASYFFRLTFSLLLQPVPIWGRHIKFSISTFSGILLLHFLLHVFSYTVYHHSTSVSVVLSFGVHPLPSAVFSLLHVLQSFSPHDYLSLARTLIFSHIMLATF